MWRLDLEQTVKSAAVHQVGADQTDEGERAGDRILCGLRHGQQQGSEQSAGDLYAHGVVAGAEKATDLEGLLDPAEEQLDRPTALIETGDFLGRGIEIVA